MRVFTAVGISTSSKRLAADSRSMGSSNLRIMFHYILSNSFTPIIVMMTTMLGMAILSETGLSFLGVGIEPPGAA